MPTYSSDQFYRDWRYAVAKDFVDPDGQPFQYDEDGRKTWDDELRRLDFSSPPNSAAISHQGRLLAVAVDQDIHIFGTEDFQILRVLKGHTSRVDVIAFKPGDANVLVSCAVNYRSGSVPAEPTIIFWDLEKNQRDVSVSKDEAASISWHAARAVTECLADLDPPRQLAHPEQEFLAKSFEPLLSQAIARNCVSENIRINGRLTTSFQSNVFSPSGTNMMYLPSTRPISNSDAQWDIRIYSTEKHQDILTLTGHRDAIMWCGYNIDETLIGSVAWDQTMRIWNASNGELKYKFITSGQNWTGSFSPDSKTFAGTCGDGSVHVYSLDDGTELQTHDFGKGWCRVLSWSPEGGLLTVGGGDFGKVILIDIGQKKIIQERMLSSANAQVKEDVRRMLGHYLEVYSLKFVDGGKKIVHLTSGDGSAEVYDITTYRKWRFARAGTDTNTSSDTVIDDSDKEKHELTSKGGFGMEVWEDSGSGRLMLATVDGDAARIWSIRLMKA